MKKIISALAIMSIAVSVQAGVTKEKYDSVMTMIQTQMYDSAYAEIQAIKAVDSTDPEYYALAINYYVLKAYKEWVEVMPGVPEGIDETLIMRDSTGAAVGYITEHVGYDLDTLGVGVQILREGLKLYPDRLDMRIGLVHIAQSAEMYEIMTDELLEILKRRIKNNDRWLWSFSEPLAEDPREFILENIQVRASMLFNLNSPKTDSLATMLSEALVENFPDSPYGHANLGTLYALKEDYARSLDHYLMALQVAPHDAIVINNIASLYEKSGQIEKAIEYYNVLLDVGDEKAQAYAKQQLERLQK